MMSFSAETTEELSGLLQDLLAASQSRPEMLTHFQVRIRVEYLSVQTRDAHPLPGQDWSWIGSSQSRPEMLTHFQVRIRVKNLSVQAIDAHPLPGQD